MRRSLTRAARAARSIRQRGYAIVPLPSTMHNLMLSSAPGAVQGMRTLVELAANRAEAGGSVGLSDALFVMRGPASGPHHPARHIVREAVSEAESQALRVARESADAGPAAWTASAADFSLRVGERLHRRSPVADGGSARGEAGAQRDFSIRIPLAPIRAAGGDREAPLRSLLDLCAGRDPWAWACTRGTARRLTSTSYGRRGAVSLCAWTSRSAARSCTPRTSCIAAGTGAARSGPGCAGSTGGSAGNFEKKILDAFAYL